MSEKIALELPQAALWLLRLACHPDTSVSLVNNPVAFANWYATAGEALKWPDAVAQIQEAERAKKLTLDRMLKLLSQLNYGLTGQVSATYARRILEGYAVHDWAQKNYAEMVESVRAQLKPLEELGLSSSSYYLTTFAQHVEELGDALELSPLEKEILAFCFFTTGAANVETLLEQLATNRWSAALLWTSIFNAKQEDIAKALRPTSPLRISGILRPGYRYTQVARVSGFWLDLLMQDSSLTESILEELPFKPDAGAPARLQDEDMALASAILKNSKEPGVNLLLYGAASLEKGHITKKLLASAGKKAWRVKKFEEAGPQDSPSLTLVAFNLLKDEEDAVLVIEKPELALHPAPSAFIRMLFGIELDNDLKPFDEHLLGTNSVPGLWYAGSTDSLAPEAVAKFVFQAPLKKANKEERIAHLEERVSSLKLASKHKQEILKLEGVSSAQLESAVKAAKLAGFVKKADRDAAIVQAIRRSQRALGRDLQAKSKPSVTQYSMKYLNTAGKFGPAELLNALKQRPKGSVVLYGIPGTGKTQFVEHVALELGMPLVTKRASDLLSKWLGESEKNIAGAFEEASNEDAILFLDEGDSFLRDRSEAKNSWEVTQVNELLQHMERFDGIFFMCTNLFRGLDAAALRRFTFKMEFLALDADQRWEMFLNETGLRGTLKTQDKTVKQDWWERLIFMNQLTAGDFATVKRQCDLLGTTLTPEEWLQQLEIEVRVKSKASTEPGLA